MWNTKNLANVMVIFSSWLRRSAPSKKVKDLKVLDGKAAQNILILLNGTLKHTSYEEVKSCLLKCEGPVISDNILQGLIQYLPPPDQLSKLQLYKDQYDDLTEAEQFCITVSTVEIFQPTFRSCGRRRFFERFRSLKHFRIDVYYRYQRSRDYCRDWGR